MFSTIRQISELSVPYERKTMIRPALAISKFPIIPYRTARTKYTPSTPTSDHWTGTAENFAKPPTADCFPGHEQKRTQLANGHLNAGRDLGIWTTNGNVSPLSASSWSQTKFASRDEASNSRESGILERKDIEGTSSFPPPGSYGNH